MSRWMRRSLPRPPDEEEAAGLTTEPPNRASLLKVPTLMYQNSDGSSPQLSEADEDDKEYRHLIASSEAPSIDDFSIDDYMVKEGEESSPPFEGYTAQPNPIHSYTPNISNQQQPERQQSKHEPRLKRKKTIQRVELFRGNLVLDCPVPKMLLASLPKQQDREFSYVRYTAATCEPQDFVKNLFTLRQPLFAQPRKTEICIAITMFNEDEILFARTMHSIMKNISYLCKKRSSPVWGVDAWKKVVVCIISDGRTNIHPKTLAYLASIGVYQDGIAKNRVNEKEVNAHIYEYTTQLSIDPNLKFKGSEKGIVPVQVVFCLKEKNKQKINSHRWFFQALCPVLQPTVCVLLDVGTRPGDQSIYHLWKSFDVNPRVAGACGEVVTMKGKYGSSMLNPLVATQNFEYKMSNLLDKPLESVLGFISVLPGAFSAYRFEALQNDENGNGPLESYFRGELQNGECSGIFEANMYLAEDRVLCFELVSKRHEAWTLHYVKSAYADTDVPDRVPEFILQRRRWLNGSFFAAIHSVFHYYRIFQSTHTFGRKVLLIVEFFYLFLHMLYSWFNVGNFFIIFYVLTSSVAPKEAKFPPGAVLAKVVNWIYGALLIPCFILALGNRPHGSTIFYTTTMVLYGLLMCYLLFCSAWIAYRGIIHAIDVAKYENSSVGYALANNTIFVNIVVSLTTTYGMYALISIISCDPWHMLTSFVQYLILSPMYTNILSVYAFCNTHDVSWGTKGEHAVSNDLGIAKRNPKGTVVEIAIPTNESDIDDMYEKSVRLLASPVDKTLLSPDISLKKQDFYKNFRTFIVLAWIFSNLALVAVVINLNQTKGISISNNQTSYYLAFLFWSVVAFSAVRFVGCIVYLFLRIVTGV
ncbi:chitin synthase I [Schizosaccharomyces cryophilus OY26]|uniref:Chitin synthase n=1 Tax=Schizosaccharomyces cryophilus (strain OY26 / ATCC MYA-4695 / CBS 11777 / NBRC 106824 / NRRL Y48691) TaxID=653667 RepID=S9VYD9_SCHCR|nr:chitin synthase I [Schizosaccharomyces cryophilus OY26]EPY52688.1 chitin synthase I [Schizosaccharomyces cryophilus OY26]